jgi:hypothetical protein
MTNIVRLAILLTTAKNIEPLVDDSGFVSLSCFVRGVLALMQRRYVVF